MDPFSRSFIFPLFHTQEPSLLTQSLPNYTITLTNDQKIQQLNCCWSRRVELTWKVRQTSTLLTSVSASSHIAFLFSIFRIELKIETFSLIILLEKVLLKNVEWMKKTGKPTGRRNRLGSCRGNKNLKKTYFLKSMIRKQGNCLAHLINHQAWNVDNGME
jgi:hypothetical protein